MIKLFNIKCIYKHSKNMYSLSMDCGVYLLLCICMLLCVLPDDKENNKGILVYVMSIKPQSHFYSNNIVVLCIVASFDVICSQLARFAAVFSL